MSPAVQPMWNAFCGEEAGCQSQKKIVGHHLDFRDRIAVGITRADVRVALKSKAWQESIVLRAIIELLKGQSETSCVINS